MDVLLSGWSRLPWLVLLAVFAVAIPVDDHQQRDRDAESQQQQQQQQTSLLPSTDDQQQQQQQQQQHLHHHHDQTQLPQRAAMERLLQVFGLQHPGRRAERHTPPPQYMLDLYNMIADSDSGLTKHANPYQADVVRSFPDCDSTQHHLHFTFTLTGLTPTENLLQAEFHLYKLKSRLPTKPRVRINAAKAHLLEMRVYQVMSPASAHSEEGNRLLDARRVSTYSTGWEVFQVKDAVADWITNSSLNFGLLVTVRTVTGERADSSLIRVVKRRHHNGRQPILVLFTNSSQDVSLRTPPLNRPKHEGEIYSAEINEDDVLPSTEMEELSVSESVPHVTMTTEDERSRQRRHLPFPNASPSLSTQQRASVVPGECSRRELYVDFEAIGWSSWIISPKGYHAYYCAGACSFPLGQNLRPTNHATVQSIVHELGLHARLAPPCCVPNKLLSISLLYYDDHANVILKHYDDMVAGSCGCQ